MFTLFLVDLQEDFLDERHLEPHRESIVANAAALLQSARAAGATVIHVRTTIRREPDERMRHWKLAARWRCVEGTPGHVAPDVLAPASNEIVLDKRGFEVDLEALRGALRVTEPDLVIVAGVHLHACVRHLALQLNELGLRAVIARDAVGSHEPAHAAATEVFLRRREIAFETTASLGRRLAEQPTCQEPSHAAHATILQIGAVTPPIAGRIERNAALRRAADLAEERSEGLAMLITEEIGKPARYARGEVARVAALFRAVAEKVERDLAETQAAEALVRRRPLGTVAVISPWNNPMAIAAGQLAPAYAYGNCIIWKPSPAGWRCAEGLRQLMLDAGIEKAVFGLLPGDAGAVVNMFDTHTVDGVCFTGSTSGGRVVAALCGERLLPLQAELGGNNAVIVAVGADQDRCARETVLAAFGCAGQRCTATRRAIVLAPDADAFVELLIRHAGALRIGDPRGEDVVVGPLVSLDHAAQVRAVVARARAAGCETWTSPAKVTAREIDQERFCAPVIVRCDDPEAEIVQEETFGPVLVVQTAASFGEAVCLLNGVRQGLVGALYGGTTTERLMFLEQAKVGLLKIDQPTVEAGVDVPFCGWKASGIGPPQHGDGNREFFTRAQAVYAPGQAAP